MRIQHNIMALSAYRQYNTNTKALASNLEKLSSGYKINRAGDDAAGLAISEKMRAQITGLDAAQKNVKDGISLVKTAEGAMQEIHDMLNKMDYLATQSANGTYQDEVDRENLQKEVESLKAEINRIADSSNFNGIKLLDGSLDSSARSAVAGKTSEIDIPEVGTELGVNTILHKDASTNTNGTTFSVDMHDIKFTAQSGEKMTITLGEGTGATTIEIEATADAASDMTAQDIIDVLTGASGASTDVSVKVNNTAFTPGTDTFQINNQDFTLSDGGNGRLTFTQDNPPADATEEVNGNMKVTIAGAGTSATTPGFSGTITTNTATQESTGGGGVTEAWSYDLAGISDVKAGAYEVEIAGQTVSVNMASDGTANDLATAIAGAIGANGPTDGFGAAKYTATANGSKVVFTASSAGPGGTTTHFTGNNLSITPGNAAAAGANPVSGDYNPQTTKVTNVTADSNKRLASTVVTLKESMVADGNALILGGDDAHTYTFTTDETYKDNSNNMVYIGDMVGEGKKIDMEEVARRISKSAESNDIWTVSAHADRKGLTLVEKADASGNATGNTAAAAVAALKEKNLDLTTEEGIKATLGFKTAGQEAVDADDSKGLTLQIGDDSESYNQMKVSIGDMHVYAMGDGTDVVANIDIGTQEGAQAAVSVIKGAINYVSSVRGDLGAIQNRLDHTANNLSVMSENIQDAESTIRDTDVAEEMMAYVKNNILVQSAQAMLAQANQLPQGVLQLLG